MDVRLLEAFRAVVDHRSVTNAAAAMGVTQPAVSAQIARLEQELGFSLFDRGNGRLKPTAEGMLFYAEASKALTGIDRLAQAAEQIRTAQTGRLVIASHPSAAISLLPAWSRPFLPSGRACLCACCRATPTSSASCCRPRATISASPSCRSTRPQCGVALSHALRGDPAGRGTSSARARF